MKRILSTLLVIAVILIICSVTVSADASGSMVVTVSLTKGEDRAYENYLALSEACQKARPGIELTVKIASPDVYYVGRDSGAAIRLYPHTVFDLNGATLMRAGSMGNVIQNCDYNGLNDGFGYDISENITVKNGTIDGAGGSTTESNLCNIGHAKSVSFVNMTLKNSYSHLIEFNGCCDCKVVGCTFNGMREYHDDAVEAIQFDVCESHWNGVYQGDGTVCRNMTVEDCTFLDFPSGVGNHKGIYGNHSSGITIKDCLFKNSKYSTQRAIWLYAYDDSKITGNKIIGNYGFGIFLSGCSNTTISDNDIKIAGTSIHVTRANSYTDVTNRLTTSEYSKNVNILSNRLYEDGYDSAIRVQAKSVVQQISDNVITSTGGCGVYCSATAKNIRSNKVTKCGSDGICITNTGVTSAIDDNVITNCGEYGIRVNNSSLKLSVYNNQLSDNAAGDTKNNATVVLPAPSITSVTCAYTGASIKWGKVTGAEKYRVFYKSGSTWKRLADTTSVSYIDTTIASGTTRIYTVRCVSYANVYTSNYDTDGKKLNYVAAPKVSGIENKAKGAKLTWQAIKGAAAYRVYLKNSDSGWKVLANVTSASYTHTASGGESYTYTVRCLDAKGKTVSAYYTSGWKNTFIAPPAKPTLKNTSSGVKITFTKPAGGSRFRIFRKTGSTGWKKLVDTTSTGYTDSSAKNGVKYTYTVRCINTSGSYVSSYDASGSTITCKR